MRHICTICGQDIRPPDDTTCPGLPGDAATQISHGLCSNPECLAAWLRGGE